MIEPDGPSVAAIGSNPLALGPGDLLLGRGREQGRRESALTTTVPTLCTASAAIPGLWVSERGWCGVPVRQAGIEGEGIEDVTVLG